MKIPNSFLIISCVLIAFILYGCSRCGEDSYGPKSQTALQKASTLNAYIDSINPVIDTGTIRFQLYNPLNATPHAVPTDWLSKNIWVFGLYIDKKLIQYEIIYNDHVRDTLTINYSIEPVYYDDACEEPQLIPKAFVANIYTQGHLFKVIKFH